jgi:hypothetical protein
MREEEKIENNRLLLAFSQSDPLCIDRRLRRVSDLDGEKEEYDVKENVAAFLGYTD